jgi:hypothetical protein
MRNRIPHLAVAGALLAAAALPAGAQAESLVFIRAGNVWLSHADGSGARKVTSKANGWAWPSMAGDGTIFAAGGKSRVNPDGSDSDGSDTIFHLSQSGAQIGPTVETPGSRSTPACPTYAPTNLRVAPDGRRVAYDMFFCDSISSFWEDLSNAHINRISGDYSAGDWLDDGRILITHIGPTFQNAAYAVYEMADPDSSHGPGEDPYLTERKAAAARSGSRVAVYEDDPNLDGSVHAADIRLYSTENNDVHHPVQTCTVALDAGNAIAVASASPTLTSDGSTLAWAMKDGIHAVSAADCSGEHLLVPGGAYPSFGAADPLPAARVGARSAKLHGHRLRVVLTATAPTPATITGKLGKARIKRRTVQLHAGRTRVALALAGKPRGHRARLTIAAGGRTRHLSVRVGR